MTDTFQSIPGFSPAASAPSRDGSSTLAPKIFFVQTQAENAGAQEVARQLATGAAARGYRAKHIFFFRRTDAFDAEGNVSFCARQRPSSPLGVLKLLYNLYRQFRDEAPDVVVSFQHYGNLIAAPLARLAGVKLIIANQVSSLADVPLPVRVADTWLGRLGFYDKIVINSSAMEAEYAKRPAVYRSRCLRIDHGFMDKSIGLDKAQARQELGLPSHAPLLGCSARLHPQKRIDLAIRVLAVNVDQHLVVAGQGADRGRLEALAQELGVTDRVHFAGELSTRQIGVFLSAIDCFVFPSAMETFGLAPVEAAQAGIPAVVTDLEVLRDVLSVDGTPCALFVEPTDTEAFAAAVRRVFENESVAAALSASGRRLKDRFPLKRMIDEYIGLFDLPKA